MTERDRVDALRYRWIREHFRFANNSMTEIWLSATLSAAETDLPEELDGVIDAGRQITERNGV